MALLGFDGRISLEREAPDPIVFGPNALHRRTNSFLSEDDTFWSGDEVVLFGPDGLPTDSIPEGTAQYGGAERWEVGSSRWHIADDGDRFYRSDDNVFFYEQVPSNLVVQRTVFIHRDLLGRISFYSDQLDAMEGSTTRRLEMRPFDWNAVLLMPRGTGDYTEAVLQRFMTYDIGDYGGAVIGEQVLGCPCDACPPKWSMVCELRSWDLETDAAAIDTTSIGAKYGESVKSIVSGSGTMDFYVDRTSEDWSGEKLLRLVLMTEKGCKAHARFVLSLDREGDRCKGKLPGALFYETEILLTNCAISVRLDEAIIGSARFATTGPLEIRAGRAA